MKENIVKLMALVFLIMAVVNMFTGDRQTFWATLTIFFVLSTGSTIPSALEKKGDAK